MSDVHARIEAYLQHCTLVRLTEDAPLDTDPYLKAGVIPFGGPPGSRRYYLMKPLARHRELAPPPFQICKGTRMQYDPSRGWQDIRADGETGFRKETLAATALREGLEEIGLPPESVAALFDLGPYPFYSAKSGQQRDMWLFGAQLKDESAFLPDAAVAAYTQERGWLTLAEFDRIGRSDHRAVLRDIDRKLMSIL